MIEEFSGEAKGPYRSMPQYHYERPTPIDPAKVGLFICALLVSVVLFGPVFEPNDQNSFVGDATWSVTDDRWSDIWPYQPPVEVFLEPIVMVVIETNSGLDVCIEDRSVHWQILLSLRSAMICPHGYTCSCGPTMFVELPRRPALQEHPPRRRRRAHIRRTNAHHN